MPLTLAVIGEENIIKRIGGAFTGNLNIIGLIVSILLIAGMLFMLFKPYKEATKLTKRS